MAAVPKSKLNVHKFPRPPLLERTPRHLVIKWNNAIVADSKDAYWALETTHPPSMRGTDSLPGLHLPCFSRPPVSRKLATDHCGI